MSESDPQGKDEAFRYGIIERGAEIQQAAPGVLMRPSGDPIVEVDPVAGSVFTSYHAEGKVHPPIWCSKCGEVVTGRATAGRYAGQLICQACSDPLMLALVQPFVPDEPAAPRKRGRPRKDGS